MEIKGLSKWILPVYLPEMRDYHTRINVFYGGAGSGKSYFVAQKMAIKALRMQRKVLVIRKVGATIKDSVWALFKDIFNCFPQVIKSVNKTDYTIELINGSVFIFKGLDDSEKIKSIQGITDIIIEEATEIEMDDFTQLNLRLRSNKPFNQIHMMFNPVSKANWVYQYFFVDERPQSCKVIQTTYKDNIKLPKDYIDSLQDMERKNPAYYRIYALGEFATLDKLVFPVVEKRLIAESETKELPFWAGMDFGYTNDPTAINWGYFDTDKKIIYIVGEYDQKGMTNDVIAEKLNALGIGKERIVADSAEPKSIEELRRLGISRIKASVKGSDSIINGIDKMQRCDIVVDERCTKTIEEFENYTWEKDRKTGEYINRPIDTFNHHIDAIRYGLQTVIGRKKSEYKPLWM